MDNLSPALVVPRPLVEACGAATQTWAGFHAFRGQQKRKNTVFAAIPSVADKCGLPARTAEKHVPLLLKSGWLRLKQIEKKNNGKRRRRARTYGLRPILADKDDKGNVYEAEKFALMPMWATRLPKWSQRIYLAVLISRYRFCVHMADMDGFCVEDMDLDSKAFVDETYKMTHAAVTRTACLSRPTSREARGELIERRLIGFKPKQYKWDYSDEVWFNFTGAAGQYS
jgi:hypothetical protein